MSPNSGPGSICRNAATLSRSSRTCACASISPAAFFGRVDRRVHAVEERSFSIAPNETLSLVGESGCGKSTTAKAIAGLVPYTGTISIGGRDLACPEPQRPQGDPPRRADDFSGPYASLDPRMRVGELVAEPLLIHGVSSAAERRERVAALFERVGLSADQMERYPHEFSGGQRQRIWHRPGAGAQADPAGCAGCPARRERT